MHAEQKKERIRIRNMIGDYCSDERSGKDCLGCPLNAANVCGYDFLRDDIPISRLKQVEKIIKEEAIE